MSVFTSVVVLYYYLLTNWHSENDATDLLTQMHVTGNDALLQAVTSFIVIVKIIIV